MELSSPVTPVSYKWYEVLREVVLRPSLETFQRILADPKASMTRIFLWMVVYSVINVMLSIPFLPAMMGQAGVPARFGTAVYLVLFVLMAIGGSAFAIVVLYIEAWILRRVASLFKGSGSTGRLAYLLGVVSMVTILVGLPLSILSMAITAGGTQNSMLSLCMLPFSLALTVYTVFLQVQAVRTEENLSAGNAFLVLLIPGIVLFVLGFVCVLLALIPVIQNIGV